MSVVNQETGELTGLAHAASSEVRLLIDEVTIADRYRSDFGDIDGLARSIAEVGLLQPILVNSDHALIAGERRLQAVRQLGMTTIPARVVANLDDAVMRLKAERDENTCRKEMTMSELVAIGKRLEELERPKAVERRTGNLPNGPRGPLGDTEYRRTSEVVGEALGISRRTYDRAKEVIGATEDEDPIVAEIARAAVDEMDRTGKVRPAEEKVRDARKPPAKPKAPPKFGGNRKKHLAVLDSMVTNLDGLAIALDEITELDRTVTCEEAGRITGDLSRQIRSLNRINRLLKERNS